MFVRSVLGIPRCNLLLKLCRIPQLAKVESRVLCVENGSLLREVPIVGVIQRVFNKVAYKHPHTDRWFGLFLKRIGCYELQVVLSSVNLAIERVRVIVPFVLWFGSWLLFLLKVCVRGRVEEGRLSCG